MLSGCANTVWNKPGATAADFAAAQATCDYQSELGTPSEHYGYGISGGIASGIAEGIRKAELMQLCMKAAGWHQEKVPTVAETQKSEWSAGYQYGLEDDNCQGGTNAWMRGCTAGLAAKVTAAK